MAKRIFTGVIKEMELSELKKKVDNFPICSKETVLSYLKTYPECAFTSAPVKDFFTGKIVYDANNLRTDGIYRWSESEIYHFEKYNLKLNDDFIEYVLKRS